MLIRILLPSTAKDPLFDVPADRLRSSLLHQAFESQKCCIYTSIMSGQESGLLTEVQSEPSGVQQDSSTITTTAAPPTHLSAATAGPTHQPFVAEPIIYTPAGFSSRFVSGVLETPRPCRGFHPDMDECFEQQRTSRKDHPRIAGLQTDRSQVREREAGSFHQSGRGSYPKVLQAGGKGVFHNDEANIVRAAKGKSRGSGFFSEERGGSQSQSQRSTFANDSQKRQSGRGPRGRGRGGYESKADAFRYKLEQDWRFRKANGMNAASNEAPAFK